MEKTRHGWWCDRCWQFSDTEVCPNHTTESLASALLGHGDPPEPIPVRPEESQ